MTKHQEVYIAYGDQEGYVDRRIAPLVLEIWKAGIETYQSCEDRPPGWVWLQFPCSYSAEMFLSIVGDFDPAIGSLHDRMLHGYDRIVGPRVGQWRYELIVENWAVEVTEDGVEGVPDGPPDFGLLICVSFPQTDLPEVLRRLRRARRARGSSGKKKRNPSLSGDFRDNR